MPHPLHKQGQRCPLTPCLVILALGLLAGKVDPAQIQRFGTRLSQRQRKALGSWLKKGTRFYPVPTYTVLRELLLALDLDAFADVLTRWLQNQAGRLPASLALNCKTIRDLALIAILNKGHELAAAQKLLRSEAVHLLDCVVTADPRHCQKETAQVITKKRAATTPWASRTTNPPCGRTRKRNWPGPPLFAQTEPNRGRIETRAVSRAAGEPDALPFFGTRRAFDTRNATTFKKDGHTTRHTRYFVTSLTTQEARASHQAALARGQWSVENPNHWRRDALWGEDRCRLRNKNAACALALLRTALLRPLPRCGWGTTRKVFERIAARPGQVLERLANRSFP